MKEPGAGEENGEHERGKLSICGDDGSEQEHRRGDDQFGYGQRDAGEMDETTGKGPGYEQERQRPAGGSRVTDTRTALPFNLPRRRTGISGITLFPQIVAQTANSDDG